MPPNGAYAMLYGGPSSAASSSSHVMHGVATSLPTNSAACEGDIIDCANVGPVGWGTAESMPGASVTCFLASVRTATSSR
eukprot:1709448-Prymnesium_polylepis.1